jgi:hypothetical protein
LKKRQKKAILIIEFCFTIFQRLNAMKLLTDLFKNYLNKQKESINIIHLILLIYYKQTNLFEEDISLYYSDDFRKLECSFFKNISQM